MPLTPFLLASFAIWYYPLFTPILNFADSVYGQKTTISTSRDEAVQAMLNGLHPKKRQVYCSLECRKPHVISQTRQCAFCNLEVTSKRKDAIYCSDLCRSRAGLSRRKAALADRGLSESNSLLEIGQCVCGTPFKQKRHWQHYCSPQCAARNRQQRRIERKARERIEGGFIPSS